MITRPVRRLMALQGCAGAGIGAWSASGHALTGGASTSLNIALLLPTAAIQIGPIARNAALPMLPFTALTICSAAFAVATATILSSVGVILGVLCCLSIVEPALRSELTTSIALLGAAGTLSKKLWQAVR